MNFLGDNRLIFLLVYSSSLYLLASCTTKSTNLKNTPTYPYILVETVSHQPTSTITPSSTVTPTVYKSPTVTTTLVDILTPTPTRLIMPPETAAPTATGIFAGGGYIFESFMTATQTICTNYWIRKEVDRNIVVYGCGFGEGYDSGYIVVFGARGVGDGFGIPTPTNTGAVRVVGAKGDKVIFKSRQGFFYIFDLAKEEFVSSLIDD